MDARLEALLDRMIARDNKMNGLIDGNGKFHAARCPSGEDYNRLYDDVLATLVALKVETVKQSPAPTNMYRVTWTVELSAEDHESAAKKAREWMLDPQSTATIFEVTQISECRSCGGSEYHTLDCPHRDAHGHPINRALEVDVKNPEAAGIQTFRIKDVVSLGGGSQYRCRGEYSYGGGFFADVAITPSGFVLLLQTNFHGDVDELKSACKAKIDKEIM